MEEKKETMQELTPEMMEQIAGGAATKKPMYCKYCGRVRMVLVYDSGKTVCTSCRKAL